VEKIGKSLSGVVYPQFINPLITRFSTLSTCSFNNYPQITTLLTTTNFINTKSGE